MRTLLYILPAVAIMALAFWAYSENYETQAALSEVRQLERQIGTERETLAILRAEWAYLNRPSRLRDLADLNFATLGLIPMLPHHFAGVEQIGYPQPEPAFALDGTITLKAETLP